MTEAEVIKRIVKESCEGCYDDCALGQCKNCEYRVAIKALEKQIAKKPKFIVRMNGIIKMYLCPCCTTDEEYTPVYPKQRCCEKCGQALLWKDSEV